MGMFFIVTIFYEARVERIEKNTQFLLEDIKQIHGHLMDIQNNVKY